MNRSMSVLFVLGSAIAAPPAFAQSPLEPAPAEAAQAPAAYDYGAQQNYGQPAAQPQSQVGQPMDPYDSDDEDDGYDVTYDISTESAETQQYDDGYDPNAYQQFESTLSPYGSWEDVPQYGRVWVPSATAVGYDFSPYSTGGHWVDSEYGWTWASDYDWGWAPFHYGRWMVMHNRGWCWLPGTVWGPAWVHWRWGGGYAGWAPMGPRGIVVGAPRGVRGPWRFTIAGQLGMPHPAYLPARVIPSVWGHTALVNNAATIRVSGVGVRINAGPPVHLVSAAAGRTIVPAPLGTVAPRAMPRAIAPRVGMPVASRPWMQSRPIGGVYGHPVTGARTIGAPMPYRAPMPQYRAPGAALPTYRAAPAAPTYHYAQPVYRGGGYGNVSVYRSTPAPAPTYHYAQPVYRAPVYNNAPVFRSTPSPSFHSAPVQTFHPAPAPTFHSAPAPSFHSAPVFHGGGGGRHR